MVDPATEPPPLLPGSPSLAARQVWDSLSDSIRSPAKDALAQKIRSDHYFLAREVLGNQDVFPEVLEGDFKTLFDTIFSFGRTLQYQVIVSPRNSYKTTLIGCRCVDAISEDRNIRILYLTNVFQNGVRVSQAIRRQLVDNEMLKEAFGTFRPQQHSGDTQCAWTDDYFFVSGRTKNIKEPTFTVGSVGTTKIGNHYDLIFIDDASDRDNCRTSKGLMEQRDWYQATEALVDPRSTYGPGGCILDNGTRYNDGDLHGWLLGETDDARSPAKQYKSIQLKAMDNPECWDPKELKFIDPVLNFDFVLSSHFLTLKRRNMDEWWWYSQYQNQCLPPGKATFKRSQFKLLNYSDIPMQHELVHYVLTDYGEELNEENDKTALWVVALDWRRFAYCIDLVWGHLNPHERVRYTVLLAEKYHALAIGVEKVPGSSALIGAIQDMLHQHRLSVRVEIIAKNRAGPSKINHIRSMQPRFEAGMIAFVMRDMNDMYGIPTAYMTVTKGKVTGPAIEEFIRFPRAPHDDLPDALANIDKRHPDMSSYLFAGASPQRGPPPRTPTYPVESGRWTERPMNRQRQTDNYWGNLRRRMENG